jgi:hypothetical protein
MRILALALSCLVVAPAIAKDITVTATPVPLNPEDSQQKMVGALEYVAGFALDSPAPEWGGYSGMVMAPDGSSLLAISDVGHWLKLELKHDATGKLTGVGTARLAPLLDEAGQPVASKEWSDAEEIAHTADGQFLISFERHHRIWRYASVGGVPSGSAQPISAPDAIRSLPENSGIEAMVADGAGNLTIVAEGAPSGVRSRAAGGLGFPAKKYGTNSRSNAPTGSSLPRSRCCQVRNRPRPRRSITASRSCSSAAIRKQTDRRCASPSSFGPSSAIAWPASRWARCDGP